MAEFFVVGINLLHRQNTWILGWGKVFAGGFFVPVQNASDEWRNQFHLRLSACHGLRQRKQQGHVAIDALALKNVRRADAFPCGSDLNEDALAVDAVRLVTLDEP